MSDFENDLQRLTFLKRTIALLSSMVDGGECHTARSNEMKNNAQQVVLEMEANVVKTSYSNCNIPLVINWVAVKDELPNQGDEVLTITEDGWYRVMTFGSTGRRFPAQVTHWQRLPKPPCL